MEVQCFWHFLAMKRRKKRKAKINPAVMSHRLKQVREAYHWRQEELCAWTGIRATNWSRYEKGEIRISLNHALELRRVTGVSLEFIYFGNVAQLDLKLLQRLTDELTA